MHAHQRYGAHEVIELHEVLNSAVDALNTVQLYAPYASDPELVQIVRHQMSFMQQEYNAMIHTVRGLGAGEIVPYRPGSQLFAGVNPMLRPDQSAQMHPQVSPMQIDDRDVASALLGMHKAGAKMKMAAALEAAHPQIRDMLLNGAVNCSHQAYEVWGYMQRRGYYPLAVMPADENAQLLRSYEPVAAPPERPAAPATTTTGQIPEFQTAGTNHIPTASTPTPATGEQPLTPVNASYAHAPSAAQENTLLSVDDTSLSAGGMQAEAMDTLGALSQQVDSKQVRGRKKTT